MTRPCIFPTRRTTSHCRTSRCCHARGSLTPVRPTAAASRFKWRATTPPPWPRHGLLRGGLRRHWACLSIRPSGVTLRLWSLWLLLSLVFWVCLVLFSVVLFCLVCVRFVSF